ncbi:MAG: hypothetical protein EBT95_10330, partial [Verrucomicrobia bacterium]|nr:hypothetical protein [Verrucomicrobiota bacterium]
GIFCYLNDFDGERLPFPAVSSDGVADLEFFSTNFPSGMRPFFGSLGSDKLYRLVPLGQGFGITSTNAIAALVDSEVIYQITANHGATNFSASGLPAGLSVEAASGAFSGSVATAGVYSNIILQAAGLAGTRTSSLTLTITAPLPGTPQITSSTNAQTATAGVAYSFLVKQHPDRLPGRRLAAGSLPRQRQRADQRHAQPAGSLLGGDRCLERHRPGKKLQIHDFRPPTLPFVYQHELPPGGFLE